MQRFTIVSVSGFALVVAQLGCSHAPEQKPTPPPSVVVAPEKAPAPPAPVAKVEEKEPTVDVADKVIYFDFDSRLLRDDARPTLAKIAEAAKKQNATIRIEGNCDERGTTEYNMALGEERARAAQKYLEHLGIPSHKVQIVSFGSERPKAYGHDEDSWAKNRRDEIVLK